MCQSQNVWSYERAGEVSHMESQKGHEDLYRRIIVILLKIPTLWRSGIKAIRPRTL